MNYFETDEYKREHEAYMAKKAAVAPMAFEAPEAPSGPSSPEIIIEDALVLTLKMLSVSNTNITEVHKGLLRATLETLIRNAFGELDSRVIVGLGTGAGKSTCVSAALFTLNKHGLLEDHPVLVLAEWIKAGRELCDVLVDGPSGRTGSMDDGEGIPEDLISHVYSVDEGGDSPEEADESPICIATHRRTRMVRDIRRLLDYKGKRRAVWIDEGILASSAFGLKATKAHEKFVEIGEAAKTALGREAFKRRSKEGDDEVTSELAALAEWSEEALEIYEAARDILKAKVIKKSLEDSGDLKTHKLSQPVRLPEPTFDVDNAINVLKGEQVDELAHRILEAASVAPESFVLVATGAEQTVLQHRRILPAELDHGVVVLDAGAEVDALQGIDKLLIRAETLPWWPTDASGTPVPASTLKGWNNVKVHWMNTHSGRGSFDNAKTFNQIIQATAKLIVEQAQSGDQILVCTYKGREEKLADRLPEAVRKILKAEGKAMKVACGGDTRPNVDLWIRTTHWGLHHSTNIFQEARIVIGLGDAPISKADTEALILGQASTGGEPTPQQRKRVVKAEAGNIVLDHYCATKILQLAGRGRSRQVINGQAREMIFAFTTARKLTADLITETVMKGSKRFDWPLPEGLKAARDAQRAGLRNQGAPEDTKVAQAVKLMLPALEKLRGPEAVLVSARSIRHVCGLPGSRSWVTGFILNSALDRLNQMEGFEVLKRNEGGQRAVKILPELGF